MTTTFATEVLRPELNVRFYAVVQGLPYVFLDGTTPTGPDGTPWAAPVSKGFTGAYVDRGLDTSQGIREVGADLDRARAASNPASLQLRLADEDTGVVRQLVAREVSGGLSALLDASLAYDTTGAGTPIVCDDVSSWPASGLAYLGRETVAYGGRTGTALDCTVAGGGARDVWSLGYEDISYQHLPSQPVVPRQITTYPTTWIGRYVQLYAFLAGVDGRALDSGLGGTYAREVYRGVLTAEPYLSDDWHAWTLETRGIDSILSTEIGAETKPAKLLTDLAQLGSTPNRVYVGAGNRHVYVHVDQFLDLSSWTADPTTPLDSTGWDVYVDVGIYSPGGLAAALRQALATAKNTTYSELTIWCGWDADLSRYGWAASVASGTYLYVVRFDFSDPNGVGPLIGCTGSKELPPLVAGLSHDFPQDTQPYAIYVSPTATSVPCVLDEGQGSDVLEDPSEPGWAVLGGKELLFYTELVTITQGGAALYGICELRGCSRARMGSQALQVAVPLSGASKGQEDTEIRFGLAAEGVSFLDWALQLAMSTGAAHHGDFDDLPARAGPVLNPAHFDLEAWQVVSSGLPATDRLVTDFLSKPIKLDALLADWLGPLGLYVSARTATSGAYLITVDRALPPLEALGTKAITTAHLFAESPAAYQRGDGRVINAVRLAYSWDYLAEEEGDGQVILRDVQGIYDRGQMVSLEWSLRGRAWSPGDAQAYGLSWARAIFARHARPYDLLVLSVDRLGWLLAPGDVVSLTIPGLVAPDGTRGLVDRLAVVVGASHRYWDPDGQPGSQITVAIERYNRHSVYCPSARITGIVGAVATCASHDYSPDGSATKDVSAFSAGDKVRLYNLGDLSTVDNLTILSVDVPGGTVTFTSNPTVTPGAHTVMTFDDYTACTLRQRAYVHTAPLAGGATAFRYA